jgi:hypothetical protein
VARPSGGAISNIVTYGTSDYTGNLLESFLLSTRPRQTSFGLGELANEVWCLSLLLSVPFEIVVAFAFYFVRQISSAEFFNDALD